MSYFVCFPFHLIFSHVALSNRYYKFFCSGFILAISGSIVYHESIQNSLITSFSRPASEPEFRSQNLLDLTQLLFHQNYFLMHPIRTPHGRVQNAFFVLAIWR